MGYLTNRKMLEHLEDLHEHLPEGWTYNTPCKVSYEELEDFREISHSNLVFMQMLKCGWSINQVLNGTGWQPVDRDVIGEQRVAAMSWAEALDDEVNHRFRHHPHSSGAYIHTMWARAAGRPEPAHAVYVMDASDADTQFKDKFCSWVQDLVRATTQVEYSPSVQSNLKDSLGLAHRLKVQRDKLDYVGKGRQTTRTPNAGRKRRGKTLADKRRGIITNRRSKAVWV